MGTAPITMGIQDALESARAARAVDRVYEAVHTDQAYPVVAPSHIMCTEEVPGVGGMSTRISERMPLNHMEAGCTIRSDWEGTKLRRRAYASGVVHPRELEAEMVHDHPGAASHHYHGCAPHSTRDSILFSRDQGALMQEEMYYARERGHMRAMDRPAVEALPAARPAPAPATAKPDEHATPAGSAQRMEHAAQALGFHHPGYPHGFTGGHHPQGYGGHHGYGGHGFHSGFNHAGMGHPGMGGAYGYGHGMGRPQHGYGYGHPGMGHPGFSGSAHHFAAPSGAVAAEDSAAAAATK